MRKYILSLFTLFCCAALWAAVTPPDEIPDYWASADGKAGKELWTAISSRTNNGFKSLGYNGLWTAYKKTDVYPKDSVGKAGKIWDMYGECDFTYGDDQCGTYDGVCDCYNREHSIPKSWFGGSTSGIGCDIFHLVPTDGKINGTRSNDEFGNIAGSKTYYGNGTGSAGSWSTDKKTIASEADEVIQGTGNVFEPKDQYKGDFARGYMGTIIKWQQSNMTSGNNFFSGVYDAAHYFGFTKKAVVLMMKWHREDPVSQKEIDRNNGIQETQGNRNPFIDYPYLAEYIWGEHAGETVDMTQLLASTDPEFVPGVSDGSRSGEEPPSPATPKYGVTWSANGAPIHTDSIKENKNITELPASPLSCSAESDQFMGWTDAPIEGTTDEEPAVLYTKAAQFPAVTEDVTYYAVFAQAGEGSSEPATYTYSADSPIADWTNTGTNKGSYWLLDSGKELTSPEVDLSGLSSIQAKLRTFGGTQYDQFSFAAGETQIGVIEVSAGGTLTDYEWTNTKSLSGKSRITFICSNAGSNKGVGFSIVTINATGTGVAYSRYITSCQSTQEIDILSTDESAPRKVLIDGRLYILWNNKIFNVQGVQVR